MSGISHVAHRNVEAALPRIVIPGESSGDNRGLPHHPDHAEVSKPFVLVYLSLLGCISLSRGPHRHTERRPRIVEPLGAPAGSSTRAVERLGAIVTSNCSSRAVIRAQDIAPSIRRLLRHSRSPRPSSPLWAGRSHHGNARPVDRRSRCRSVRRLDCQARASRPSADVCRRIAVPRQLLRSVPGAGLARARNKCAKFALAKDEAPLVGGETDGVRSPAQGFAPPSGEPVPVRIPGRRCVGSDPRPLFVGGREEADSFVLTSILRSRATI